MSDLLLVFISNNCYGKDIHIMNIPTEKIYFFLGVFRKNTKSVKIDYLAQFISETFTCNSQHDKYPLY